jgi:MYXO-CTERM domain-containing protein
VTVPHHSRKERGRASSIGLAGVLGLVAFAPATNASADVVPLEGLPPQLSAQARSTSTQEHDTRRIFVNFGGTTLGFAAANQTDDATRNLTRMQELATTLVGYGGTEEQREAILQAVRADWAAYDVVVTDRRPSEPDYVMTHVGPNRPDDFESKILGIAQLDCDDATMRRDISFAFHYAGDGHDPTDVAQTISHEVGHGFGLEHIDNPAGIMFKARGEGDPGFLDQCVTILAAENVEHGCTEQRQQTCGAPNLQNSHRDLLALLGPARVDDMPPTVELMGGSEAIAVPMGIELDLAVTAHDDVLVDRVVLYLDGERVSADDTVPFGWKLADVEAGEYEFYAEAIDAAGNSAMSEPTTLYVGIEPPEGVDADSPWAAPEDIGGETSVGCGCTTDGSAKGWGLLALLLVPLLGRRRR